MTRTGLVSVAIACATAIACTALVVAGPLDPPAGAVAPTHKTLSEVEPRVAINATNTPGDADSLYKITQPGSYYLTGNITGVAAKRGIEIAASNVTIDLMGFTVLGDRLALDGIATDVVAANVIVRNGVVREWAQDGIDFAANRVTGGEVSDVSATQNTGSGVRGGDTFTVSHCTVTGNLGNGASVGANSRVAGCTASLNAGDGIQTSFNCVVTECVASQNGGDGINANVTNVVSHCSSYQNTNDGISAGINSSVSECVSYDNTLSGFTLGSSGTITDCASQGNTRYGIELFFGSVATNCSLQINVLHGIFARDRCTIVGNTCVRNGNGGVGSGISITGNTGHIENNVCTENDRGIEIIGTRNIVVRNTCAGNTTANWDISANNVCGPILNRSAPLSAAILGDSAPSSLATTDPNANFTH